MVKVITAVLLLFSLSSYSATLLPTHLDKVTVHLTGASLIRTGEMTVPAGRSEWVVRSLSPDLDPEAFVLNVFGNGVQVRSVHNRLNPFEGIGRTFLADSILTFQDQLRVLELSLADLKTEKEILDENSRRVGATGGIGLSELNLGLEYYRKKAAEIVRRMEEVEKDRKKISVTLQTLQLRQKADGFQDQSSEIYFILESPNSQKVKIELRYFVTTCGWAPFYIARTKGAGEPMNLEYKAHVLNRSGENWENINLTLSLANPSLSLDAPEMETWVLAYGRNRKKNKVFGYNSSGSEGNLSKKQIKDVALEFEEKEIGDVANEFVLSGNHSIPSAPYPFSVPINQFQLNPVYRYKSVPKLEAKAYLIAGFTQWEDMNLVEGEVQVFLNESFHGFGNLDPLGAGDTLEFSLGPDPKIQITRVKKRDFSSKRFLGLSLVESFSYEIDIRNLNNTKVNIEIQDQIPIPQQSDIEVKLDERDNAAYTEGNGKLVWKMELPSKQESKLKMGFTVKYPRDKVVIVQRRGRVICPKFR